MLHQVKPARLVYVYCKMQTEALEQSNYILWHSTGRITGQQTRKTSQSPSPLASLQKACNLLELLSIHISPAD
jgi:hypothetical protein